MIKDETLAEFRYIFQSVLVPIIVFIGVVGNSLSVIILTRRRMRSSTNIYLTALAVADIIYLLLILALSFKHHPKIHRAKYELYWRCYGLTAWICDASSYTSIYITVCLTIERYIAVCHPIKGQVLCTESRAKKVIAGVVILCILTTCSTCFEYQLETDPMYVNRETGDTCQPPENKTEKRMIDPDSGGFATTLDPLEAYPAITTLPSFTSYDLDVNNDATDEFPDDIPSTITPNTVAEDTGRIDETDDTAIQTTLKNFKIRKREAEAEVEVEMEVNESDFISDEEQSIDVNGYEFSANYDLKSPEWSWPGDRVERALPDTSYLQMNTIESSNIDTDGNIDGNHEFDEYYIKSTNSSNQIIDSNEVYEDGTTGYTSSSADEGFEVEVEAVTVTSNSSDLLDTENVTEVIRNATVSSGNDKICHVEYFLDVKQSSFGSNPLYQDIFMKFTSTVFTFIPLVLLMTFNIFLFLAVRRSNRLRTEMTKVNSRQVKHKIKYIKQENKITITLMAVVLLFIICQTPTAVYILMKPKRPSNIDYVLGNVFNFLISFNAASNFVLYCVFSDKYRATAKQIFLRYRRLKRGTARASCTSATAPYTSKQSSYYFKNPPPFQQNRHQDSMRSERNSSICPTSSHLSRRTSVYQGNPRASIIPSNASNASNSTRRGSRMSSGMPESQRRRESQLSIGFPDLAKRRESYYTATLSEMQETPDLNRCIPQTPTSTRFLKPSASSSSLQRSQSLIIKPKPRHSPDCRNHPDNIANNTS